MQRPITCFLVDNDEEDQEIFSMALKDADPAIHCVFANDCPDALKKLATHTSFIPSLIFIDMNMPFMDGMQCLQEIKNLQHLKTAPVYMYSTSGDAAVIARVKKAGANDFIVKPPSIKKLTEILSQILHHHKLISL